MTANIGTDTEDPQYVAGKTMGAKARAGKRVHGNTWELPDGTQITAPDGRTKLGRGFWAAMREGR